jgi:hypothetical protein
LAVGKCAARGRRNLLVLAAMLPLVACGSGAPARSEGPSSTTSSAIVTTTTPSTTTSAPKPTIPLAELDAKARRIVMAPGGLKDIGGVATDEHGEQFALTEVCNVQLIVENSEYANYYRFWKIGRGSSTVKNIGYAYHRSTAADVINELGAALIGCHQWTEVDGTDRVMVPNVALTRPDGLSAFRGFCQDSPDGRRRYACVAYLGQGNLVSRLSVARPDYGKGALDELQSLLPRAAQSLLAAQG